MAREHALHDLNLVKFIDTCFMAPNIVSLVSVLCVLGMNLFLAVGENIL